MPLCLSRLPKIDASSVVSIDACGHPSHQDHLAPEPAFGRRAMCTGFRALTSSCNRGHTQNECGNPGDQSAHSQNCLCSQHCGRSIVAVPESDSEVHHHPLYPSSCEHCIPSALLPHFSNYSFFYTPFIHCWQPEFSLSKQT